MSETTVDARNLLCPLPVIRTQDTVQQCASGDRVRVLCTDPGVLHDIPAWCRVHGHEVSDIERDEDRIVISIIVGDTASS